MRRQIAARALAGVAAVLVALAAWGSGALSPLEDATVDARFGVRHVATPSEVVVVDIDESSIAQLGAWPWRRRLHARALDRIRAAQPAAIVYDVQFTEPSPHAADDVALYEALGRAGGAVLASGTSDDRGRTDVMGGDEALAEIGSRAGAANLPTDREGVVRRYPRRIGRLASIAALTAERVNGRPLPASAFGADGTAPIDFRGGTGAIPHVSFADLLAGRVPAAVLRGKVVVVGATAPTLQDRHATATSGHDTMPGPELQANAIWTALHGNPLRDAPLWIEIAGLVVLGFTVPLVSLRARLVPTVLAAAGLAAAGAAGAQLLFDHDLIVDVIAPLVALILSTFGTIIAAYALEARRRRRAAAYGRALEHEVAARTQELRDTQLEIIQRLSQAAEHRDDETGSHLKRMSRLCGQLARAAGATDAEAEVVEQASILHDIGKIGIPDDILHKPGKLTPAERTIMQTHTTIAASLLAGSPSRLLQHAEEIARTHHEKWDGSGYPAGLAGADIPWAGRVAALCDVYDALLTQRPYKRAWTVDAALAHIEAQRGSHFDPELADIFVALVRAGLPPFQATLSEAPHPPLGEGDASGRVAGDAMY